MPIRAITFDAEGTLWDVTTAVPGALDPVALAHAAVAGRATADRLPVTPPRLADRADGPPTSSAGVDDREAAEGLADRYLEHRQGEIHLLAGSAEVLARLGRHRVLGLISDGDTGPERAGRHACFVFELRADVIGIATPDLRTFHMAAAAAGCAIDELVHVSHRFADAVAARRAGARAVWLDRGGVTGRAGVGPDATIRSMPELPAVIDAMEASTGAGAGSADPVGVGPHPRPWPEDARLDPELLASGDRRNVVDRYRYWRTEAVVADLDGRRHAFHVAVENWCHDLNIGTVVRNANAFLAAEVHIIGRRRWNRRGAMVTDRYQHVRHHATVEEFVGWAAGAELPIVGVDNLPGATPIDSVALPERCVLLFGQEGPGLSTAARRSATVVCSIRQFGSTRSINAGVASGIAMHAWTGQHAGAGSRP